MDNSRPMDPAAGAAAEDILLPLLTDLLEAAADQVAWESAPSRISEIGALCRDAIGIVAAMEIIERRTSC